MSLMVFLVRNGFYLDEKVARLIESVLRTEAPRFLLRGPPGSGKTHLTSLVARFIQAEYIFYQCTSGTSENDLDDGEGEADPEDDEEAEIDEGESGWGD